MRKIARAVLVCAVVSLAGSIAYTIAFGGGVTFDPAMDHSVLDSMPYTEAVAYMEQHSRPTSGWQSFISSARHLLYWRAILEFAGFTFAVAISSYWLASLWNDKRRVMPPNTSLERTREG
jgi:hypothetical protein